MAYRILILGASYGSLLGTKLLMAGHDVTLLCRDATAALINNQGTDVRIRLRGEDNHRSYRSGDLPGCLDAKTPETVDPAEYDLVCLAMQEPQYSHPTLAGLLNRIADGAVPCISLMNMPPLPYLRRIPGLDAASLEGAYTNPRIWDRFDPALMSLCSPDPQAFRPPEEQPNVLQVNLPTNFKMARFHHPVYDQMLEEIETAIDQVRIDGNEIPVKLRAYDSLFVPFAKWCMLATGNYRCITEGEPRSIRDAVGSDLDLSREIYSFVEELVARIGADPADRVPFKKYAKATQNLVKPSSAARAIEAGATAIERVDKLIWLVGQSLDMTHPALEQTVAIVDQRMDGNQQIASAA